MPLKLCFVLRLDVQCVETEVANSDAAFAHAWVERHQISIAANEKQCSDEQHHRDRDLGDDHQALDEEVLAIAKDSTLAGLECSDRIGIGTAHRRDSTEDKASESGHHRR